METNVRTLRAAAVCGIMMQLGWLNWILSGEHEIPWGAAAGISVGLSALAAGLVYGATQGCERRGFYATVIVSSGITWGLLWGLIGYAAGEILGAPIFETAGLVIGPLAGSVFGCLVALRARAEPRGIPELVVLGAIAGALTALGGMLDAILGEGPVENWVGIVLVFAALGALTGIVCRWVVSRSGSPRLTPST